MSNHPVKTLASLVACAALLTACAYSKDDADTDASATAAAAAPALGAGQVSFASPEAAVQALSDMIGTGDQKRLTEIFGAEGVDLLLSGDDIADKEASARIKVEILEKVAFEDGEDDTKVALFGNEGWPFPVPLVQGPGGWFWDVESGWQEIKNRRIGRNELRTLVTLRELVEGQREYVAVGRDGNPRAFAKKLVSSPGKHDGLYWPAGPGEPQSPFGPEFAAAAAEGYTPGVGEPEPFHGFMYRLLTAQGAAAPGGAKSFVDGNGRLTGGFAMVAWPAKYGNSGVTTFLINHKGIAFQRDLGEDTANAVASITSYDPDSSWDPVGED